jgi:hypothetical protein
VNKKTLLLATLLIGGLGIAMFGGEDDPAPTTNAQGQARFVPKPQFPALPVQPKADGTTARYPAPYPTDPGAWSAPAADPYRFRPLSERERERHNPYPTTDPQPADHQAQSRPSIPTWAGGDTWAREGYRFRPIKPNPGGGTRWEGPSSIPPWGGEPGASDQWADRFDPPPWRSPATPTRPTRSPPAQRMLPSLDWWSDRTFTAR